jgi:hypothetical protein
LNGGSALAFGCAGRVGSRIRFGGFPGQHFFRIA